MLAFLKLVADFSRGCAGKRIDPLRFATHPYPVIRELRRISASMSAYSTYAVSTDYRI